MTSRLGPPGPLNAGRELVQELGVVSFHVLAHLPSLLDVGVPGGSRGHAPASSEQCANHRRDSTAHSGPSPGLRQRLQLL
eukprot:5316664-Pyramimonas_sp.AAC.1